MHGLHVNSLIGETQEAVDTYKRHNVLNLTLALYEPLFSEILNPRGVKGPLIDMLTELIMIQNQNIQVRFIRVALLLV